MNQRDSADTLIEQLGLEAHPEGGWYRETWRGEPNAEGRASGTAIIFLLKSDERSHWHRVDADEMWLWQGGDPLSLLMASDETRPMRTVPLGNSIADGEAPQCLVPKGNWQAAQPSPPERDAAGFTLVSCIVVPGFEFSGFELAPLGWTPGRS